VVVLQPALDLAQFQPDDLLHRFVADRVVRDDHHAAEEGWLEDLIHFRLDGFDEAFDGWRGVGVGCQLHDRFRGRVGGQDDDGVLEVDFTAFAVFHAAFVEDLEEEFQDVGVGLFHFVQEDHRVGLAADGFSEYAAFAVADVSGRRAFQRGDGVGFLKLAHGDGDHVVLAAIEEVGDGEGGFGFTDAGGADEHEDADGLIGIFHLGFRDLNTLSDGLEGVILADDALAKLGGEIKHGLNLVFEHFAHGDAGPGRDDFTDLLGVEADGGEGIFALQGYQFGVECGEFGAKYAEGFGGVGLLGGLFDFAPEFANLRDETRLFFEAGGHGVESFLGLGFFSGDFGQPLGVIGIDGLFAGEDAFLDVEIVKATLQIFDGGGGGVLAERELGAGGVEDADGFIGQLAAGDITMGEADGGVDSFVEDAYLVVVFKESDDAAHHDEANVFGGLFDFHDLETAGEGGILFEVLLILAPGGGGDGAKFAAGESGFEEIGGIAAAGRAAGADHGVGFVDEEDDGFGAGLDLFNEAFQAVFEFAFDAGAGLQQREI